MMRFKEETAVIEWEEEEFLFASAVTALQHEQANALKL